MTTPQLVPAYKGDFANAAPARILYRLAAARESGIVQFNAEGASVNIVLGAGEVEDIHSKSTAYNLLGYMLMMGRISQEQATDMSTVMADLGGRVIDTLVSLGILKSHEVIQVYQGFMKVVTAGVLQFKEGSYVFYRYQGAPPPSQSPVKFNTFRLVLEAACAIADAAFYDDLFHSPDGTRVNAMNNPRVTIDDVRPAGRDLRAYRLCEQGATVGEMLATLKVKEPGDRQSLFAFLYVLHQLELITMQVPPRAAPGPSSAEQIDPFDLRAEDLEPQATAAPAPASAPAPVPAPAPSADIVEIAELTATRDRLKASDLFGRLGVTTQATDGEVKKAYLKLAKSYHPDTNPIGTQAEIRTLKGEIFEMVAGAFKALETADARAAATRAADEGNGEQAEDGVDIVPILQAEQSFMRAKTLLRGGRGLEEALNLLTEAVNLNAGEPEYRMYYNWALWLARGAQDPSVKDHAIAEISAILKDRKDENGWLFLGQIFKTTGDGRRAEEAFKKVIELSPDNHIAALELRLMQKRQKK